MSNQEQNIIDIEHEDGTVSKCEVYDIVEFEDKAYALLAPIEEDGDEDPELIVLEYIEEGEECYFQNIEDDEEFNRVCEYIESLADDVEE